MDAFEIPSIKNRFRIRTRDRRRLNIRLTVAKKCSAEQGSVQNSEVSEIFNLKCTCFTREGLAQFSQRAGFIEVVSVIAAR